MKFYIFTGKADLKDHARAKHCAAATYAALWHRSGIIRPPRMPGDGDRQIIPAWRDPRTTTTERMRRIA